MERLIYHMKYLLDATIIGWEWLGEYIIEIEGWQCNKNKIYRQIKLYDINQSQQSDNDLILRMTYLPTVTVSQEQVRNEGMNAS